MKLTSKKYFLKIFNDLITRGNFVSPRGQMIREVENYSYILPPHVRFCNFKSRRLNLDYIKKEFLWYLKGDKYDASITEHAVMWKSIMNEDGSFNSNYGQYFFGKQNQFDVVLKTLKEDKDSRRASMLLLTKEHVNSKTNDVPCTYALNFRIRNNKFNMSVHMRSQDAIFGMGNDAPAFSFIHEMMYNALLEFYPRLEHGNYHHIADSFHVYEKHFEMVIAFPSDEFIEIECPKISGFKEVKFLRKMKFDKIPEEFKFTRWLMS